jgi:nucleoside-diphosphate-sugar epimerase
MLTNRKVLVTGATGFIGGRLVEKLLLTQDVSVRAVIRDFSRCARLARFPVEMVKASLKDPSALQAAVEGCDVVLHCAYDWESAADNLAGIDHLAKACLKTGIRRLVHVSTMAVYEPLPDRDVTEKSTTEPNYLYAKNKLAVERRVVELASNQGLPAVIIQPAIVYGPFGGFWTDTSVERLLAGKVVLPAEEDGLCNAVYVDDVVEAIILAGSRDDVIGERFLISGPEPVTWREFYGAYAHALGVDSIELLPRADIERRNKLALFTSLRKIISEPGAVVRLLLAASPRARAMIESVYTRLSQGHQDALRQLYHYRPKGPVPLFMPNAHQLELYSARSRIRSDKAIRLLGYNPQFRFEDGMHITREYIRWAYPKSPRLLAA